MRPDLDAKNLLDLEAAGGYFAMERMNARTLCPIIVALDVDTQADALTWVDRLGAHADIFKVGLQLFCRTGFSVVEAIIARNKRVFVDLKLHDIPHTIENAVRAIAVPGVEFLTVHACGGADMIEAAVETVRARRARDPAVTARILAVTVLTSLDDADLRQMGVEHSVSGQVLNLARVARVAGADGIVSSAHEVRLLRAEHGPDLTLVTPGIRPRQESPLAGDDQKRVMTPAMAMKEGSDFLVMGRSLLETPDAVKTLRDTLAEMGR